MEGGGGVGGQGRGSAPQQRRAWNTDSLLLPGQMSPTPAISCVLTSPGVAGTRVPKRGCFHFLDQGGRAVSPETEKRQKCEKTFVRP